MNTKPLVVSQRSWHYRLLRFAYKEDQIPKTLCGYFWSVVLAPVAVIADYFVRWTIIAAVGRILSLGALPAAIIFSSFTSSVLTLWGVFDWRSLAICAGAIAGVIVAAILIAGVGVLVSDRRAKKTRPESTSTSRLLLTSLQAKKRRVCPLIEVQP